MNRMRSSTCPPCAAVLAVATLGCGLFLGGQRPAAADDKKKADFAAGEPAQVEKADLEKIQAWLAKSHPKVRNAEPKRKDSPAIRRSYPNHRFYVIFMLPPRGIPDSDAEHKINLSLSIDADGNVIERSDAKSFQVGLAAVTDDESARAAAAAIMSLLIPLWGDTLVKPEEVTIETKDGVRTCHARTDRNHAYYELEFDAKGTCTKAGGYSTQGGPP